MRTSVWVAVLCSSTRRVLVARRAGDTNNAGQWNFFGGGVGSRESLVRTAIRELKEEASLRAAATDLVRLGKDLSGGKKNVLFGLAIDAEVTPELNRESDAFRWMATDDLAMSEDLHAPTSRFIDIVARWAATLAVEAPPAPERVDETVPVDPEDMPVAPVETTPEPAPSPGWSAWARRLIGAFGVKPSRT